MKTAIVRLIDNDWILHEGSQALNDNEADLVLCFSSKSILGSPAIYEKVRTKFPNAEITMCSTAGEIYQNEVLDYSFVAVAMKFDKTAIITKSVNIKDYKNTFEASQALIKKLPSQDLAHVLVFSDGSLVNGSELVKGLVIHLPADVLVTGGLAGDGPNFKSTLVGLNQQATEGEIVVVGFYGNSIQITHGSQGGWEIFGLEKRVTKSSSNVLMEIEGQNALDLYKKYLGEESKNLPGSALLFPLSVILPGVTTPVVRTILSVNELTNTMTFAGDVPEGSKVRFMKANFDKLVLAAEDAATQNRKEMKESPSFSLLVSCVGRKIILGERVVEEVNAVRKALGNDTVMGGFYSYGEISPFNEGGNCQLHNQTMTITSFYEN